MEKPQHKILDLQGHEFQMAVERERKNLVNVPAFDLDAWLSREPTGTAYNGETYEHEEAARQAWLYDSKLPLEVLLWNILVEPRQPKEMSVGGILLAPDVVSAESFKTNIGRIVHVGSAAWQSQTTGGIDLRKHRTPKVGDMVVHRHYTGLEMIMQDTGKRLRIMDDTDVIGIVKDPEQWRMYL